MNKYKKYLGSALIMFCLGLLVVVGMSGQQTTLSAMYKFAVESAQKYEVLSHKAGFEIGQYSELKAALVIEDKQIIDVLLMDEEAIQEQHKEAYKSTKLPIIHDYVHIHNVQGNYVYSVAGYTVAGFEVDPQGNGATFYRDVPQNVVMALNQELDETKGDTIADDNGLVRYTKQPETNMYLLGIYVPMKSK